MGAPDLYGAMAVCLEGYPASAESLDFIYTRRPRRLLFDGYDRYSSDDGATTVSAASGTSVTVDSLSDQGTKLNNALIRLSNSTSVPTAVTVLIKGATT